MRRRAAVIRNTGPAAAGSSMIRKTRTRVFRSASCCSRSREAARRGRDSDVDAMNVSEPFILAPGWNDAAHGGDLVVRLGGLRAPAAVDLAAGRLSDDPGADVLSRRQSGSDDVVGYGAVGTPAWPDARAEPDDLGEFGRRLDHHPAIQPRSRPRRGRAGGAGRHQCRQQSLAKRSSRSARLCEDQPCRRTDPHACRDLEEPVAHRPGRLERDQAGAEDLATDRRRACHHQRRSSAGRAHSVQTASAGRLWPQYRRSPDHDRQLQRQHSQGKL